MLPQIPEYLTAFESALRPAVLAIGLGLIWIGAFRVDAPQGTRYALAATLSLALVVWLAVAQYLGAENVYFAVNNFTPPVVLLGLLIPVAGAAIGLRLSERFRAFATSIPLHWLVAAQVYRVGGGILLVLWLDGRLPWQFALPAGFGDVATGIAAIFVAMQLEQDKPGSERSAYAWSLFGIADLVIAVTMGALTSPGLPHLLAFDTPNMLITAYPLVMVPTFAVPLALILHGLVLWRLRQQVSARQQLVAA